MKYKKILKFSLFIFYFIVGFLVIFITFDCIRLRYSNFLEKPLIVFSENKKEENANLENFYEYTGLGYKIKYTYYNDSGNRVGKSAEFKLFGKFLIWAWIE